MKLSIRAKITLISMAILLIAICLSTVVSGYIFINEYIKVLQNNANIIGQNLKMQLDRLLRLSIPINDLIGFEKQCSDMVEKYKEISYAMVVNREGRILFHNDPEIMDQSLKDSKTYEALLTEEESLYTTKYNNMNFYEIIIPVYDRNNAYAGIVGVGFPQSIIFQKINSVIISIVILTVILLIVSIILLILALTRWVNQPLASLVNVIQDISENKLLDTRVKIYSRDEFGHFCGIRRSRLWPEDTIDRYTQGIMPHGLEIIHKRIIDTV